MSVARELALGVRLAVTGGRSSRLRAAMTAVGVGLGVALLLFAASIPSVIESGQTRDAARDVDDGAQVRPGPDTLRVASANTTFRGDSVRGQLLQPDGDRAPAPPARELPGPAQMVVSPALGELLASDEGRLLRERLDADVVGTIGAAGLRGPRELAFYRGSTDLELADGATARIRRFGSAGVDEPLPAFVMFLVAVGVVVLLLPVAVFIAAAVRFGGEERDRRLAALRLIGADRLMTSRIAAGEALFGSLAGVVFGAVMFLALRPLVERVTLLDLSVFATDVRPSAELAALIVVAVPVAAVIVSLLALRRVVVEPLGVVRGGAQARRRLWWRPIPIAIGVGLLVAMRADLRGGDPDLDVYQVGVGVGCVLVGITALLPWVVDVVVGRLGGGGVAWQLATRRLQMDGGTAARVVSGVAVAVAGAIALQSVLTAGERESTRSTGAAAARAQMVVQAPGGRAGVPAERLLAGLRGADGVAGATAVTLAYGLRRRGRGALEVDVRIGDCASLREFARIRSCRDGDVFVGSDRVARPGERIRLDGRARDKSRTFTIPSEARRALPRRAPNGYRTADVVLATPAALPGARRHGAMVEAYVKLDRSQPEAVELVRNAAARVDARASAYELRSTSETAAFRTVRRALFAAAIGILLLIGASLLVGGLEQLRERRPVLAALTAVGTPRVTLARSVLWQAAVPVVLGLAVSVLVGTGLASLLLSINDVPVLIDWGAVLAMAAAGAAVVLLVTALTLPALWRLTRPEGLRTE